LLSNKKYKPYGDLIVQLILEGLFHVANFKRNTMENIFILTPWCKCFNSVVWLAL